MVCNCKTNHPGEKHFVKSVNTVRLYSAVFTYCFVWTADIEGGKGTGGESIYGPFFEGTTLYSTVQWALQTVTQLMPTGVA